MQSCVLLHWPVVTRHAHANTLCVFVLQERIGVAQYAHLPLACLRDDWVIDTADALFARLLRDAEHLLWAADTTLPGLSTRPDVALDAGDALDARAATEVGVVVYAKGEGGGYQVAP